MSKEEPGGRLPYRPFFCCFCLRSLLYYVADVAARVGIRDWLALWLPFAAGLLIRMSESADFLYKTSDYYAPESEGALRWKNPRIGIQWPRAPGVNPSVSSKDAVAPDFAQARAFEALLA